MKESIVAYKVIVEKLTLRVAYIVDASVSELFDALWPPVKYSYLNWVGAVSAEAVAEPWNYVVRAGELVCDVNSAVDTHQEQLGARRAAMLLQLARTIDAYRRVAFKGCVFAQQHIYDIKADEARRCLADAQTREPDPLSYPFVDGDARHDGISLYKAANLIIFRHTQQRQILQASEQKRRYYTRQILCATLQGANALQTELDEYERRA